MSHRIQALVTPVAPPWPSFQGTSKFVGTSPSGRVTVYVDPTLGAPGLKNAQDLVADADRVADANDAIFGTVGGAVSVIVFALGGATDGTGGADHNGCDFTTGNAIEVCASFGNSMRVSALFEAELSECSMGGNLCGVSTGEALSRWCATQIGNNALSDFTTAPAWAQDGLQNFVDRTDPTDQNADSTGCGMAFLSWLMSQGHSLSQIAKAMVALATNGTLAQLYAKLTLLPVSNAWPAFQAAIRALPKGITSDDPFAGTVSHSVDLQIVDNGKGVLYTLQPVDAAGNPAAWPPENGPIKAVSSAPASLVVVPDPGDPTATPPRPKDTTGLVFLGTVPQPPVDAVGVVVTFSDTLTGGKTISTLAAPVDITAHTIKKVAL